MDLGSIFTKYKDLFVRILVLGRSRLFLRPIRRLGKAGDVTMLHDLGIVQNHKEKNGEMILDM